MTNQEVPKMVYSDANVLSQSKDGTPATAAVHSLVRRDEDANLVPYSMIQSRSMGTDEKVGWANYLDYM